MMAYDYPHPVSRTYQYKKITKPLLERKRRARINNCLEELKDLMVDALETEGENISKLEKADILELTVRHLQRLQQASKSADSSSSESTSSSMDKDVAESRWQSGFGHCAAEACTYLASLPGKSGEKLAQHLASDLKTLQKKNINKVLETTAPKYSDSNLSNVDQLINLTNIPDSLDTENVINSEESIKHSKCFNDKKKLIPTEVDKIDKMSTDDDEEIDVVKIDDKNSMWRPW